MADINSQTPKEIMISRMEKYIEENHQHGGVSNQLNAIHANKECLPVLESLDEKTAEATYKAIQERENYDPEKDKFGWGPTTISPIDFLQFIPRH